MPVDHRIEFHHEIFNESGKLLTVGKVVLYFMHIKTREKTTMPAAMYDVIKMHFDQ